MTDAPERIWAWEYTEDDCGQRANSGEWYTEEFGLERDETEYIRADLVPTWHRTDDPDNLPPEDGTKFDAWCAQPQYPNAKGVRLPDVQMRGDGSGFGFIVHLVGATHWQYLDARKSSSPIFPAWEMTHWKPLDPPPDDT